jgi:DNA-binding NarL/FixJ family response regulator
MITSMQPLGRPDPEVLRRYEQALTLAQGPESAVRAALAIAEDLGVRPFADTLRERLRQLGARHIPRGPRETTRKNPAGLTVREVQVLELLAQGCTNARIARVLYRSQKTVDHHVSAILGKLGVSSRARAVAAAFAAGILEAARMPVTVSRRTVVTQEFFADEVDMFA